MDSVEAVRESMLHDRFAKAAEEKRTCFHAAVDFLRIFCRTLPAYRDTFITSHVFGFLTKVLVHENVGLGGLLVDIFDKNAAARAKVAEAPWSVAEWAVAPRFDNPRDTVPVLVLG